MAPSPTGPRRSDPAQQSPEPGRDYTDFPAHQSTRGERCFRNHDLRTGGDNGAWWFSSAPSNPNDGGRYDLPTPDGTCYLAMSEAGAVWERIGPDHAKFGWVWSDLLDNRVISELHLPHDVSAADISNADAAVYRVTNELITTSDYALTQDWARTLHQHGFDAVISSLRFSPGGDKGLALFGPTGAPDPAWDGDPDPAPIKPLVHLLGIDVIDRPDPAAVTVIAPPH